MEAPLLPDERERIAEVTELGILDSPKEERFDRITRLASRSLDVPIALVTVVDVKRQWFKSSQGLQMSETPRSLSFCAHAILGDDVMIVPDARLDSRFATNDFVTGEPYIRFYAGQPLVGPRGYKIGTLCVLDHRPRQLIQEDLQTLRDLAALAQQELINAELRDALQFRSRAEREVRGQAALLNLANEAIIVRHIETNAIQFWNRGAEELYGWSAREALGQLAHHLLKTVFPRPLEEIREEVVESGRWEGELRRTTRAGRHIVLASRWALQRNENDQPAAILETNIDVSARKHAEDQLRNALATLKVEHAKADNARSTYRAVLDASSDGMVLISPDKRFLSMNRRFSEIFGVTSDELEGRSWDDVQDLASRVFVDPEAFAAHVAGSAVNEEREFTENVAQRWPQNRELEMCSTPVCGIENNYLGRLYVFRDVTGEREVERMKEEFVSLVSHELRTPLTSINGYIELLLDGEVGDVSLEQSQFLQIVKNNSNRLIVLVNELLDASRIESGMVQLRRLPFDLASLIKDAAQSLRPQFENKNQRLTLKLSKDLPGVVGDADRTMQILANLLANACKYTPPRGCITVRAEHAGEYVRVDVEDTGIGLSAHERTRVFDKFYRARNRGTQEASGTGLGLMITLSLVEMQGGQMDVVSAPGEGSTFSFTVPVLTPGVDGGAHSRGT